MSRPADKRSLLRESQTAFDSLIALVNSLSEEDKTKPGVNEDWSVKDILAHLFAWHEMLLAWYAESMTGKKPQIPAPGYTWKTTPQLNERIFMDNNTKPLGQVLQSMKTSHLEVQQLIEKHSDLELFTKNKYPWTGSTSMGCYFVSATSSHYQWAIGKIKNGIE